MLFCFVFYSAYICGNAKKMGGDHISVLLSLCGGFLCAQCSENYVMELALFFSGICLQSWYCL